MDSIEDVIYESMLHEEQTNYILKDYSFLNIFIEEAY